MKLTKMIVDANMNIMGFIVQGKAREFGEMGNETYERPLSIKYLMDIKFNNSQIYCSGGTMSEKGGFHINELPMIQSVGGQFNEIPNSIELTSRYVMNNENIGFGVRFGNGHEVKYKYTDVMKLAELFKPVNFVIKVNDSGKQFIAGKSGSPLGSLPAIELGGASTAKKTKSGAKPVTPVTGVKVNEIDILDLFEFVEMYEGFILNFPKTDYKPTGDSIETAGDNFKPLGIGEVANARLDFNETKFNASCKFRNPGTVTISVPSDGPSFIGTHKNTSVYSYVFRTKNIFYNGEHHLSKLGIIIPERAVDSLISTFGASMAVTEVTDAATKEMINQLIGWTSAKIFEVDTSKLALISPKKYEMYIMDAAGIYRETLKLAKAKISLKYVRGAIKQLEEIGTVTAPKNRSIASKFAGMSEDELKALIYAGVDIFTGAFTESGTTSKNPAAIAAASPEVNYIINGLDPKNYDFKKLTTTDKCPDFVAMLIDKVEAESDLVKKSKILQALSVELGKSENDAKRTLWMHKASMWLKANKLGVHKDDAANWVINTKKRTKATCYDCTVKGAEGLQLLVLNTDIAK